MSDVGRDDPGGRGAEAPFGESPRWQAILSGDTAGAPGLARLRRIFKHLPSDPRCKLCYAPYAAPFGPIVGALGFGRWKKNPTLCGSCLRIMERAQGGAEIELSMLFADLRDSTRLASTISARAYSRLLNAFYAIVSRAVEARDGSIDKFLGDGVFALFIPGFSGSRHAAFAIDAALRIRDEGSRPVVVDGMPTRLPVGIGVHTGAAYVGVVGRAGELTDFTALGEAVNLTERLSSAARASEVLISDAALVASGLDAAGLTPRQLDLKGIEMPVTAWSSRTMPTA